MVDNTSYKIKIIDALETHNVRHPILRSGKPIESCIFSDDNLDTTIHLGLYMNKKLIGVSSFIKKKSHLISGEHHYQLRGMAILNKFQGKGLGNIILNYGETLLKKKNIKTIWCNAREVALNFYKKNDYQIIGEPFHIEDIGKHYTMYKLL